LPVAQDDSLWVWIPPSNVPEELVAAGGGLSGPRGMAIDSADRIYISNTNSHTISRVEQDGTKRDSAEILGQAGGAGRGGAEHSDSTARRRCPFPMSHLFACVSIVFAPLLCRHGEHFLPELRAALANWIGLRQRRQSIRCEHDQHRQNHNGWCGHAIRLLRHTE